jgi:hypothetical protein
VIPHPAKVEGLFFRSILIFFVEPGTSSTSNPRGVVTPAHLENSQKFSNALYKNRRNCAKLMLLCKSNHQGHSHTCDEEEEYKSAASEDRCSKSYNYG